MAEALGEPALSLSDNLDEGPIILPDVSFPISDLLDESEWEGHINMHILKAYESLYNICISRWSKPQNQHPLKQIYSIKEEHAHYF